MPFHGVRKPELDAIVREALRRHPIVDAEDYRATVQQLWALPHREERYAAIAVARRQHRFVDVTHVDLYRRLIVEGAWWDLVDDVAHIIGRLLLADRATMRPLLDVWIDDDDLWLRRTALLSQLDAKDATDAAMLFAYCERRMHEREFFIRKAIGWALRQYARVAPEDVRAFCLSHRRELSALSIREAMKHLGKDEPPRDGSEKP
jgi:3-methyladenine DNA glycosylase AlkD